MQLRETPTSSIQKFNIWENQANKHPKRTTNSLENVETTYSSNTIPPWEIAYKSLFQYKPDMKQ